MLLYYDYRVILLVKKMQPVEKIAYAFSGKNRQMKYDLFEKLIVPEPKEKILDVGVNNIEYSKTDNYLEKHYKYPENITAVGPDSLDNFKRLYPKINCIIGRGEKLPFTDQSFDIGYSNAVLEHVGTRKNQVNFVKELYRVSKRGYITTPNRLFPIEIHTRVPFLHLILSKNIFDKFLRIIGKEWATGEYMTLLSRKELVAVLNEAGIENYRIIPNKIIGITATFTIVWQKSDPK